MLPSGSVEASTSKGMVIKTYCCGLKSSRKGCMKKLRKCSQKHWECYRTHDLITLHQVIAAFPGSLRIERLCECNQEPQNSSQVYLWGDRETLSRVERLSESIEQKNHKSSCVHSRKVPPRGSSTKPHR